MLFYHKYLRASLSVYLEVYRILSSSLNNNVDRGVLNSELKSKYRQFQLNEKKFTDILENSIVQICDIENPDWCDYVKLQNNGRCAMILRIRIFVDKPDLNYYGIIIEEKNSEKHYRFKQDAVTNKEHVIKITSDISMLFNDELVDKVRAGEIVCESRIRISYEIKNFPLLKIPFHIERPRLENAQWTVSVLDNMDYHIQETFDKSKRKKAKTSQNTLTHPLFLSA